MILKREPRSTTNLRSVPGALTSAAALRFRGRQFAIAGVGMIDVMLDTRAGRQIAIACTIMPPNDARTGAHAAGRAHQQSNASSAMSSACAAP
jgi:hypothetical protein